MSHSPQFLLIRRMTRVFLPILLGLFIAPSPRAQTNSQQEPPAKTEATPAQSTPSASNPTANAAEVTSRDTPATFKVRVNLVLVRAVVRDAQGKVVTGLKKEDFQISDNRKPQVISSFGVETPGSH